MMYNASMKKRYILLIFIILFGLAMWGLITALNQNTPTLNQGLTIS